MPFRHRKPPTKRKRKPGATSRPSGSGSSPGRKRRGSTPFGTTATFSSGTPEATYPSRAQRDGTQTSSAASPIWATQPDGTGPNSQGRTSTSRPEAGGAKLGG